MNAEIRKSVARVSSINSLLGIWILISPFVLRFAQSKAAAWNDVVVGILIFCLALIRVTSIESHAFWSWCNTLLGVWLVVSPFVLGFSHTVTVMLNNIVAGAVVAVLAVTSAYLSLPHRGTHHPDLL